MSEFMSPAFVIAIAVVLGVLPTLTVVTTSFLKIAIVLNILRNAFGTQQVPPTFAINGIAFVLTLFIMAPTLLEAFTIAEQTEVDLAQLDSLLFGAEQVSAPLIEFMVKNARPQEFNLFSDLREDLWPQNVKERFDQNGFFIVAPAFILSEVRAAFEIGFLIYIPFIIIDMVGSSILISLGMQTVNPNVVTIPIKLLLFVFIDGWTNLTDSLIKGYY